MPAATESSPLARPQAATRSPTPGTSRCRRECRRRAQRGVQPVSSGRAVCAERRCPVGTSSSSTSGPRPVAPPTVRHTPSHPPQPCSRKEQCALPLWPRPVADRDAAAGGGLALQEWRCGRPSTRLRSCWPTSGPATTEASGRVRASRSRPSRPSCGRPSTLCALPGAPPRPEPPPTRPPHSLPPRRSPGGTPFASSAVPALSRSSRTDKGVHALHAVLAFELEQSLLPPRADPAEAAAAGAELAAAVNAVLPAAVRVVRAIAVRNDFHAQQVPTSTLPFPSTPFHSTPPQGRPAQRRAPSNAHRPKWPVLCPTGVRAAAVLLLGAGLGTADRSGPRRGVQLPARSDTGLRWRGGPGPPVTHIPRVALCPARLLRLGATDRGSFGAVCSGPQQAVQADSPAIPRPPPLP